MPKEHQTSQTDDEQRVILSSDREHKPSREQREKQEQQEKENIPRSDAMKGKYGKGCTPHNERIGNDNQFCSRPEY